MNRSALLALLVATHTAHADVELEPLYRHAVGEDYLGASVAGTFGDETRGLRADLQLAFARAPAGQAMASASIGAGAYVGARLSQGVHGLLVARISIDSDDRPAGDESQLNDTSSRLGLGVAATLGFDVTHTLWLGPSVGATWRPIELGRHHVFGVGVEDAYTLGLVFGLRL